MYRDGKGVPQDYEKAVMWFRKAAEQGDALGQASLGCMYHLGKGIPQDYAKAYAFYNLAAAQGNKTATKNRTIIIKEMSQQQISKAQELSAQLQYKIDNPTRASEENISTNTSQIKSTGTGFIITKDGYIVTCHHIIHGADSIQVKVASATYSAELVHADKYNDLALLKISGKVNSSCKCTTWCLPEHFMW